MAESPQVQMQRMEMAVGSDLEWSPPLLLPVMVLVLVLVAPQLQAPGLQRPHPLQRKRSGLLARPPEHQTPPCS